MRRRRFSLWAAVVVLLMLASRGEAHLVNTGFGPFYDGLSHLFLSPDDLLGILALAGLAGLGGARAGRRLAAMLPLVWLAGGIIGLQFSEAMTLPVFTASALLVLGFFVALDRQWPSKAVTGLAITFGLVQGVLNGSLAGQSPSGVSEMAGVTVAVAVMTILGAAVVVWLGARPPWTRVMVRVAGSWISATGLLLLGWTLRSGTHPLGQ